MASPSIGDYLPPGPTLEQSSVALLPGSAAAVPTGWQGQTRPTLDGQVDLVTGLPLARVVDLELPFGSATFRLTRTRSAHETLIHGVGSGPGARRGNVDGFHEHERWWDWVGQGWMAGENPFLIVDSALPDVVGPNPRTTYLVLDAHHSIPFQRVLLSPTQVAYEAPPRFRARMEHDGVWGPVTGPTGAASQGWQKAPTQYDVWLYDGALRYTFVAIRDDVPVNLWDPRYATTEPQDPDGHDPSTAAWAYSSLHDFQLSGQSWTDAYGNARRTPGYGIPHYAICVRIRDAHGNAVEIEYCDVERTNAADSLLTPPRPVPPNEDCIECQELCLRKGQIKSIQLTSPASGGGGSRQVHWTLLYVHRLFAGTQSVFFNNGNPTEEFFPSGDRDTPALRGNIAIDRIYVYPGLNQAIPSGACLTIGTATNPYRGDDGPTVNDGWQHQVRYFYRPEKWTAGTLPAPVGTDDPYKPTSTPVLAMTEVSSRVRTGPSQTTWGPSSTRHTFFRYSPADAGAPHGAWHWLERIYTDREYGALREWSRENPPGEDPLLTLRLRVRAISKPLDFAFADLPDVTGSLPGLVEHNLDGDDAARAHLHKYATVSMQPWKGQATELRCRENSGLLSPEAPVLNDLVVPFTSSSGMTSYISVLAGDPDRNALVSEPGHHAVRVASVRNSAGQPRHVRMFHFVVTPKSAQVPSVSCGIARNWSVDLPSQMRPNRSVRFHPYRWFASPFVAGSNYPLSWPPQNTPNAGTLWTEAADLSQPRWIRVIDEFGTPEERDSAADGARYGSTAPFIKRGQLSRRVVTMNAAGFVLTDKVWTFSTNRDDVTVLASSTGLGEEWIYSSVQTEFQSVVGTPPAPDPNVGRLGFASQDPYHAVRNEMLLVEHRSVGWSATSQAERGTKGLIRGFKYDLVPASAGQKPAVRLFSEWVQSGSGLPPNGPVKRYTRHLFYHDDPAHAAPTDIAAQVIPLTNDVADDLRTPGMVAAALANPNAFALTRWVIKRHNDNTGKPIAERPVVEYRQIDAPRRLRPGSAHLYFPVQVELYEPATGYPTWKATGLLTTPENMLAGSGQPDEALIWSYTMHDGLGRVLEEVVDAQPGASVQSKRPGAGSFPIPTLSGFARIGSEPALNLVTSHAGHDDDGPTDIYFSNGRRWARRTVILQPVPEGGTATAMNNEEPHDPVDLNLPSDWSWTHRDTSLRPVRRDFIFSDLEWNAGSSSWIARSPGLVHDYLFAMRYVGKGRSGNWAVERLNGMAMVSVRTEVDMGSQGVAIAGPLKPFKTRRVVFLQDGGPQLGAQPAGFPEAGSFLQSPTPETQPYFRSLSRIELRPDEYGQLSQADHFERDSLGVMVPSGQVRVNDLGEMYRAMAMDGGITRLIKNSLGHVLRKYEGTVDQTWLQLAGGTLSGAPSATASPAGGHNMVLTERIEYGSGTNNAWLPTVVRRYTTNTVLTGNWHLAPFENPPTSDPHGQAIITKYDWRMRPVREDIHAAGVPTEINRLLTTFTYLNHAGQARLVATYGANTQTLVLPTSLDPSGFAPGTDTPPLAQFFASGALRPLALVETIYAPDGSVEETRTYDVAWNGSGSAPFTAEREHSGFGGSTVFRHGPGEEAEISRVDALGRVTWTASVAPRSSGAAPFSYQLSRTDYTYDVDGNVIRTDQWERILDSFSPTTSGPGDVLSSLNAVRSTTLNWYDTQRRLVASADYGTGMGPSGTFTTDAANTGAAIPEATASNRPTLNVVDGTVNRSGIPATIPISINHYNIKGELAFVVTQQGLSPSQQPVYSITGYTYTGTGKTATVTENPFTELAEQRTTMYHYQYGRLAGITAGTLPLAPPSSDDQHSSIASGATSDNAWGALVIDTGADGSAFTPLSRSASLASSFTLPGSATGATFAYDFLGRLVERTDARGVVMRYRYDDLDRLRSITVGHYLGGVFELGYADSWRLPLQKHPVDMVAYVQYDYDANHRLTDAKAYDALPPGSNLIAHTRFNYDARGNLIDDIQGIGAQATGVTPRTSYAWSTSFASGNRVGRTRLTSVSYPHQTGMPVAPPRRIVTVKYDSNGPVSDTLSRITRLESTPVVAPDPAIIATFTHTGGFRRARTVLAGGAITADMGLDTSTTDGTTGIGIRGLDGLGRLVDLHYRRSSSGDQTTITRLQTTLDFAGSRLSTRRTPHPLSSHAWLQHDSTYDPFQRLTGSTFNNFNSNNSSFFRGDAWTLDVFGNWLNVTTSVTGATPIQTTSEIGFGNRYIQRTRGSGQPVDTTYPIYDRAGNLAFDGTYCYQYDAWNRLVQVNRATRTTFVPFPLPTEDPLQAIIPGPLVKHFTHDALGRLVRVQSPFPEPAPGETGLLRTERLFYDGVRRIQEVIIDPAVSLDGALAGEGGAALQGEAQLIASNAAEELDGAATPAMLESAQLGEGDGGGASQLNGPPITPGTTMSLAREYVWGPGDWGVDELLVQYDAARRATWPILDSGGDVIALCDLGGTNNSARVRTQIVYDAYGRVIGRSNPATPATGPPELRVGHKGLFFDRLDWGIVDPLTLEETPRLEPGATLLGYNRNRTLHVGWGRFLQRDPNATGLPVQAGLPFHGDGFDASVQGFDLAVHYGDGANVYEYIGSNPLGGSDPTGLMEFSLGGQMATMAINAWDMAEGSLETARTGIGFGLGLVDLVIDHNLSMMFDFAWASDWSASDDDYSKSDVWMGSGGGAGGSTGQWITSANQKIPNSVDAVFASRKQHGSELHYTEMRLQMKLVMQENGLKFSDITDIAINQMVRKDGKISHALGNIRPDVSFRDKKGKLYIIEVGNSQSDKALDRRKQRIEEELRKAKIDGIVKKKKIGRGGLRH